jgi:quercetin dioxygenase-like cupin family protein
MPSMKGYHALKNLPEEKVTDKISRRVLTGDQEMVVWWSMKAGAHAAAHQHPHEQIFWMISGKMEFRLGNDRRMCGPGDLGLIPGGVEHEAWFVEDTEVIDIFAPPRQEFLTPDAPAYMRKG